MSAPDLVEVGDTIVIGTARHGLALEAAWEIEELCNALCSTVGPSAGPARLVVRGLSARIRDLACAVMSALGDDIEETAKIANHVRIALPETGGEA
ncbi:hypothetical protein [Aromatoleum anaerobium]|uniref:Uncharacterized protein n=1 Tax=Aromatoleum anaerobium TaxID=182180 RepID=A0ABX1PTK3_9RHOO|nr:hypothetical protein [Aromatoleum anaerobium]MCK0507367.1 hypothetical protein [Aromatoleum anaerobium]